jgi:hypothetical protein
MDQSRSKSPFGIRQIARISLGIVRVDAIHPRGESRACERGNGSGPHRARIGAKWNRCIHGPALAGCHRQGAAETTRRGEFSMNGRRSGGLAQRIQVRFRRKSAISVRLWRCGGFSSAAAARRRAAPLRSADSRARRYRPARCGRSRALRNRNNGSSRRRWRTIPWK